MPAMSDITVDPYQTDADLSHDANKPDTATSWMWPSTAGDDHTERRPSGPVTSDHQLSLDVGPPLDTYTSADAPVYGPTLGLLPDAGKSDYGSSQGDVRDVTSRPGAVGLRNLGNTCFMNAGLQCLANNAALARTLLEWSPDGEPLHADSLTGQFGLLLQKVWSGRYSVIHPATFKNILAIYHPQFKDYRQHDCQEFLALLLDSLHEQLNSGSPSAKNDDSSDEGSVAEAVGPSLPGDGIETSGDKVAAEDLFNQSSVDSNSLKTPTVHSLEKLELMSDQSNIISEDSIQSGLSHVDSSTSIISQSHRLLPIPDSIHPFRSPETVLDTSVESCDSTFTPNNSQVVSRKNTEIVTEKNSSPLCTSSSEPVVESTVVDKPMDVDDLATSTTQTDEARTIPSLEDLYMKDTKTLNTNVLASELIAEEDMAVDSDKFHKPENNASSQPDGGVGGGASQSQFDFEHLNDLLTLDTTKGDGSDAIKPFKDTNLLANLKDKFPEDADCCPKKFLFSEKLCTGDNNNFNNSKRLKMDDEHDEKNLRMAAKLKVNTDRNQTKAVNVPLPPPAGTGEGELSARGPPQPAPAPRDVSVYRPPSAQHRQMADKAWRRHLRHHASVIVDTFQGQFKSTVVCLGCHHVSVTFEPFMYLSVPLPHAMDRQISVILVPCDNKPPVRYLLTLHKQDCVRRLKAELLRLIDEESCDLVVAEVLDNHIARILEDNTRLTFVNDTSRIIYAFEMLPAPQIDDDVDTTGPGQQSGNSATDHNGTPAAGSSMTPNNATAVSSTLDNQPNLYRQTGGLSSTDLECFLGDDMDFREISSTTSDNTSEELNSKLNNSTEGHSCWSPETDVKFPIHYQHNPLSLADSTSDITAVDNSHWLKDNEAAGSGDDKTNMATGSPAGDQSEKPLEDVEDDDRPTVADQWKTCAICLEEMLDRDLMIHGACGGTLCNTCLEMTFKHYGDGGLICPVCSTPVDPVTDFIQVDAMADYKPKTRILSIPVVHRLEGADKSSPRLFGHPNILYLPSNTSGDFLYASVDRAVLCLTSYTIVLTDGQGYRCSRCLYTAHCSGCELPRDGPISLQPGDHLAVCFSALTVEQVKAAEQHGDHGSMGGARSKDPLRLTDCFTAFTQSELLDEHNPWFCPKCKRNQCANKTMTVWKYPDTLVVYLKRFVFHDLAGTKIDNKVVFPLEDMDLGPFVSGPTSDGLVYDLQGCVCHFGGINSGHYTSYARNCQTAQWTYYNDETTTDKQPQEEDYSSAYILFYQRQGTNTPFKVPDTLPLAPEEGSLSQASTNPPPSPIGVLGPACSHHDLPEPSGPAARRQRSDSNASLTTEPDSSSAYDYYS